MHSEKRSYLPSVTHLGILPGGTLPNNPEPTVLRCGGRSAIKEPRTPPAARPAGDDAAAARCGGSEAE